MAEEFDDFDADNEEDGIGTDEDWLKNIHALAERVRNTYWKLDEVAGAMYCMFGDTPMVRRVRELAKGLKGVSGKITTNAFKPVQEQMAHNQKMSGALLEASLAGVFAGTTDPELKKSVKDFADSLRKGEEVPCEPGNEGS